jgi:D-serine deaminase-like pyridoxal phosphate-dependent protein
VDALPSPCLLVYPSRIEANLRHMLTLAGGPGRLRPHLKTHKMKEILERQLALGITKAKCATIAEAELAARAGVTDLLLAYQPVGPNVRRLAELVRIFPKTKFSVICDDASVVKELAKVFDSDSHGSSQAHASVAVLLDLDIGQHRTGIAPGPAAAELYRLIAATPNLETGGLHAYGGHISDTDPVTRQAASDAAFAPVAALKQHLRDEGFAVPRVVAGGTPTFPVHARRSDVECSPGTCVLWDAAYLNKLPDLPFQPAALVLTRVVARPGPNRLCLDLGHKALAAEMPHPRVQFLNLPDANAVVHSEEHLVIETAQAGNFQLGDCLYGIPRHICPTVALHAEAWVIEDGAVVGTWKVAARERRITI